MAERLGLRDAVFGAFGGAVKVASVGPITTEGLAQHGIGVDFEPEHPKMGHLVSGLSKAADRVFG